MNGHGIEIARIWFLTDRRYLRQRMPLAVVEWLAGVREDPRLVVADRGDLVSSWSADSRAAPDSPWQDLQPGDLVVARSRHPFALALLEQAEALGGRTLDPSSAILAVRDKVRCLSMLVRCGLPVPPSFLAAQPRDLALLPGDVFPLLLKPVLGDNAQGLRLVRDGDELAGLEWDDDLVLAQRYLDAGGVDLKLYVAGEAVWAVRRRSPLAARDDLQERIEVSPELHELADLCRAAFGLVLFGIDVLEVEQGHVIVDVNEFPNYTGVEEAQAAIGGLLREAAAHVGERDRVAWATAS